MLGLTLNVRAPRAQGAGAGARQAEAWERRSARGGEDAESRGFRLLRHVLASACAQQGLLVLPHYENVQGRTTPVSTEFYLLGRPGASALRRYVRWARPGARALLRKRGQLG